MMSLSKGVAEPVDVQGGKAQLFRIDSGVRAVE